VRSECKKWLKVHVHFASANFYAPVSAGGLGIPSFRCAVRRFRFEKIARLTWYNVMSVGAVIGLEELAPPRIMGKNVGSKKENLWKDRLLDSTDGKGLAEHSKVPQAHRWTRELTRIQSGRDYIRINHLRYKTLVTNALRNRINKSVSAFCPVCINTPHTLGHIMQTCPSSHGPRVHRHNTVVEYIGTRLACRTPYQGRVRAA